MTMNRGGEVEKGTGIRPESGQEKPNYNGSQTDVKVYKRPESVYDKLQPERNLEMKQDEKERKETNARKDRADEDSVVETDVNDADGGAGGGAIKAEDNDEGDGGFYGSENIGSDASVQFDGEYFEADKEPEGEPPEEKDETVEDIEDAYR